MDLHVWHLKMFRKVQSFRLTLVHFNMCIVCSSGDVQMKFYLLSVIRFDFLLQLNLVSMEPQVFVKNILNGSFWNP